MSGGLCSFSRAEALISLFFLLSTWGCCYVGRHMHLIAGIRIREVGNQYRMIYCSRPTPYCCAYHAVCLHPTLIDGGPGPGAAQETGGGEGYEAADAATTEAAQSLPRIRTSPDDERPGGGAANGPTDAKVRARQTKVARVERPDPAALRAQPGHQCRAALLQH